MTSAAISAVLFFSGTISCHVVPSPKIRVSPLWNRPFVVDRGRQTYDNPTFARSRGGRPYGVSEKSTFLAQSERWGGDEMEPPFPSSSGNGSGSLESSITNLFQISQGGGGASDPSGSTVQGMEVPEESYSIGGTDLSSLDLSDDGEEIEGVFLDELSYMRYSDSLSFDESSDSSYENEWNPSDPTSPWEKYTEEGNDEGDEINMFLSSPKDTERMEMDNYSSFSTPAIETPPMAPSEDITITDPEEFHKAVFENEQGYLDQSGAFKDSLLPQNTSPSSTNDEQEWERERQKRLAHDKASNLRRGQAYRRREETALSKLQSEMKEVERDLNSMDARGNVMLSDNPVASGNGPSDSPQFATCRKCSRRTGPDEVKQGNICMLCNARQFSLRAGSSTSQGGSLSYTSHDDYGRKTFKREEIIKTAPPKKAALKSSQSRMRQILQSQKNQTLSYGPNIPSEKPAEPRPKPKSEPPMPSTPPMSNIPDNKSILMEHIRKLEKELEAIKSTAQGSTAKNEVKDQIAPSSFFMEESSKNRNDSATSSLYEDPVVHMDDITSGSEDADIRPWVRVQNNGEIIYLNGETGETSLNIFD